jgi:hypothetical protein
MKAFITVTDTFGGEPNYGWVRKKLITFPIGLSDLALIRRAKKAVNISGVPCDTFGYGDCIEIRPRKKTSNWVAFIDEFITEEEDNV